MDNRKWLSLRAVSKTFELFAISGRDAKTLIAKPSCPVANCVLILPGCNNFARSEPRLVLSSFRCITDLSQCSNGYTLITWLNLGATTVGFLVNSGGQTIRVKNGGIVLAHKSDGTITVAVRLREGNRGRVWLAENIHAPQEEWFHVAATWRKNGQLKVYIDGELNKTVSEGSFTPEADDVDSTMHLGKLRQSHHYHANATIDELIIWAEEKSEAEVRKLTFSEYLHT